MILTPLTLILILALFAMASISILITTTVMRMTRVSHLEMQIAKTVRLLDTIELKNHLQTIPITAVDIDEEVAALKANIINAAHKHRLTIDKNDTQTENPFNIPENQQLLTVIEKKKQLVARVG